MSFPLHGRKGKTKNEEIRDSEEENVVIDFLPKRYEGNTMIKIDEDINSHRNIALSLYFGKSSVVYIPDGSGY